MSDLLFIFNLVFRIVGSGACLLSYPGAPPEFVTPSASRGLLGFRTLSWCHDPVALLFHENSPPQSLAPGTHSDSVQGEGSARWG